MAPGGSAWTGDRLAGKPGLGHWIDGPTIVRFSSSWPSGPSRQNADGWVNLTLVRTRRLMGEIAAPSRANEPAE